MRRWGERRRTCCWQAESKPSADLAIFASRRSLLACSRHHRSYRRRIRYVPEIAAAKLFNCRNPFSILFSESGSCQSKSGGVGVGEGDPER